MPPPSKLIVETLPPHPTQSAPSSKSVAEAVLATRQGVAQLQPLLQLLDPEQEGGGPLEEIVDLLQQILLVQRQQAAVLASLEADIAALGGRTPRAPTGASGDSAHG